MAITDANKKVEQEMSYDACLFVRNEVQVKGRRRNPVDWNYTGLPDPSTYQINRGYTFHEHYDQLGLINMNGRVYDPVVGRFLSVDPVVGNPLSAQDYNGYSYCVNNPLKYTDPSGYIKMSLNEFIYNGLHSSYGGYWENDGNGSGSGSMYSNPGAADQGGVDYNNFHDSWGNTEYSHGASASSSTSFNLGRFNHNRNRIGFWRSFKDAFVTTTTPGYKALNVPQSGMFDGSFHYGQQSENKAYKQLHDQSYDEQGSFTESFALLTSNGVYVLPNRGYVAGKYYANTYNRAYYAMAWLTCNASGRNINGTKISILATLHTHQYSNSGVSGPDKSLYQYGNIIVFSPKYVDLGYRTSCNSEIVSCSVGLTSNFTDSNWSLYQNLANVPYYPFK